MVRALALAIVAGPLLASVSVAVAAWLGRSRTAYLLALAATGVTALSSAVLLPQPTDAPVVMVDWLPGAGPMGLTATASGLCAILVTAASAFLVLLGTASRSEDYSPFQLVPIPAALGAAGVAFLADHFLARYVALEIVALCVALAPIFEVHDPERARLAWITYFTLRIGDAGLLAAILLLQDAGGTLRIAPALEAGSTLDAASLAWVVAGFVLAAWVKVGGWPFHVWGQTGQRLSLPSRAWLFATLPPALGAYLLYRTMPLLVLAGPLRTATLWLGGGGAVVAALIAMTRASLSAALVYIGAALGGLVMFGAAIGAAPVVWLGLLVSAWVRPLLYLAADAAHRSASVSGRRAGAGLFGLGGLFLATFGLFTVWWARTLSTHLLDAYWVIVCVADVAVALIIVWVVRTAGLLYRPVAAAGGRLTVHWTQWVVLGPLGSGVLAGGLAFGSLVQLLAGIAHVALPTSPTLPALLRHAATTPAVLAVLVVGLIAWRLQTRSGQRSLIEAGAVEEGYSLQEGLARAAQALRAVVEVGTAERVVSLIVRAVLVGARVAWALEHRGLEGLTSRGGRAAVQGALVLYRVVEQESLEGLLRRGVRAVLMLSRVMQRWHRGQLRRNLAWVPVALALALLVLVMWGW